MRKRNGQFDFVNLFYQGKSYGNYDDGGREAACLDSERKATVHKANLLISTENPYTGVIVIKGGLPQSSLEGHGYGTRSIAAIADAHGGQPIFSAEDGVFNLKIMLPLRNIQ